MAAHAIEADFAAQAAVASLVEAGIHGEEALVFGVPAERELDQLAVRLAVQVGAGVVARAHHEVDLALDIVDARAVGRDLPTAVEVFAVALDDRIVALRRLVEKFNARADLARHVCRYRGIEGAPHAGLGICGCDFGVAAGAGGRIDVIWVSGRVQRGLD
ncbi:MAG: hypothetical protein R2748_16985 [Bryobacterales bacterium]